MSKLLTSRTCFGFTTGGHTGEEVFLAAYHPDQAKLRWYAHEYRTELSLCPVRHDTRHAGRTDSRKLLPHTEVFKDFKCEIVPAKRRERFSFTGRKNKRSRSHHAYQQHRDDRKERPEEIRLNSVIVYVDKNNTFYLLTKLAEYLQCGPLRRGWCAHHPLSREIYLPP